MKSYCRNGQVFKFCRLFQSQYR
ncbi:hypothetical protein EJA13_12310 [Bacillus canaveralius]|nr:hypothetical protein EJA13_12310 [Bacillus canaveralius]